MFLVIICHTLGVSFANIAFILLIWKYNHHLNAWLCTKVVKCVPFILLPFRLYTNQATIVWPSQFVRHLTNSISLQIGMPRFFRCLTNWIHKVELPPVVQIRPTISTPNSGQNILSFSECIVSSPITGVPSITYAKAFYGCCQRLRYPHWRYWNTPIGDTATSDRRL